MPLALLRMRRRIVEMFRSTGQCVAISLCLSLFTMSGCGYFPESSFALAPNSRLPKWFTLPPKLTRTDVTVTVNYYGDTVTLTLLGPGRHTIQKVSGLLTKPQNLDNSPNYHYPSYHVIVINGTTDIVEHRKMEPIFYVTDDPTVWAALAPKR
jgi:hypothetical protein